MVKRSLRVTEEKILQARSCESPSLTSQNTIFCPFMLVANSKNQVMTFAHFRKNRISALAQFG